MTQFAEGEYVVAFLLFICFLGFFAWMILEVPHLVGRFLIRLGNWLYGRRHDPYDWRTQEPQLVGRMHVKKVHDRDSRHWT